MYLYQNSDTFASFLSETNTCISLLSFFRHKCQNQKKRKYIGIFFFSPNNKLCKLLIGLHQRSRLFYRIFYFLLFELQQMQFWTLYRSELKYFFLIRVNKNGPLSFDHSWAKQPAWLPLLFLSAGLRLISIANDVQTRLWFLILILVLSFKVVSQWVSESVSKASVTPVLIST